LKVYACQFFAQNPQLAIKFSPYIHLTRLQEGHSALTPAKRAALEIEDMDTIWFVKAKGRDSEESQSLPTQGSNIEDDDEKRVFSARCPICDGCDAGR
jgi:hypothetical protein